MSVRREPNPLLSCEESVESAVKSILAEIDPASTSEAKVVAEILGELHSCGRCLNEERRDGQVISVQRIRQELRRHLVRHLASNLGCSSFNLERA